MEPFFTSALESQSKRNENAPVAAPSGSLSKHRFATAAIVVGFLALALATLPDALLPPPVAASGIVPLLKSAITGHKDPALIAYESRLHQLHVAALLLGIVGAALGVAGLIKREHRVLAISAIGVSAAALLWQYLIVGVIVAVVLLVMLGTVS